MRFWKSGERDGMKKAARAWYLIALLLEPLRTGEVIVTEDAIDRAVGTIAESLANLFDVPRVLIYRAEGAYEDDPSQIVLIGWGDFGVNLIGLKDAYSRDGKLALPVIHDESMPRSVAVRSFIGQVPRHLADSPKDPHYVQLTEQVEFHWKHSLHVPLPYLDKVPNEVPLALVCLDGNSSFRLDRDASLVALLLENPLLELLQLRPN